MSSSEITDPTLKDAADVLQQQLIYNGEVLDIALESLKSYKPGTQSLTYLDSSVYLAYALLRMLESWGKAKGSETYVRKRVSKKRRKSKGEVSRAYFYELLKFPQVLPKKRGSPTLKKSKTSTRRSSMRPYSPLKLSKPRVTILFFLCDSSLPSVRRNSLNRK